MNHFVVHNGERYQDAYGRGADQCREQAAVAARFAGSLRSILVGTEDLELDRVAGPNLLQRLHRSAVVYDRLAVRDVGLADEIEAADAWLADALEWDQIEILGSVRRQHNIPPEAWEMIVDRYQAEFEEALDRVRFTPSQRERIASEDRGRVMALIRRAEHEASPAGASAVDLAWLWLISGVDPRYAGEETV